MKLAACADWSTTPTQSYSSPPASGGSEILRSTDDGATLTNAAIKTPSGGIGWSDLGFTTSTHSVAVLQHTALYLSRDAGRSWTSAHF